MLTIILKTIYWRLNLTRLNCDGDRWPLLRKDLIMIIAVPKERYANELRVAASPDTVKRLIGLGAEIRIESGAGRGTGVNDTEWQDAGAVIHESEEKLLQDADVILKVRRPLIGGENGSDELSMMKKGAILIGLMEPHSDPADFELFARQGISVFAMELVPRISRAQSMDVLSSQSNLAGYKAVIDAAAASHRVLPMMMTAAGTVPPARVAVLGAGVAGLQAIATAKRLGAVVCAFDVRAAAKEEVESLGATFVDIPRADLQEDSSTGGYAREASDEFRKRQSEVLHETVKTQDIVICTALVFGRKAPVLLTEEMVYDMPNGSVIVDLAAEQGGNCALSRPGQVVTEKGVTIIAYTDVASRIATDSSPLYARNIFNFLNLLIDKESGELSINWDDEIVSGTALTHQGKIIHPLLKSGVA